MSDRTQWQQVRDRGLADPVASEAYLAAKRAYELGKAVRELREALGWTQTQLAQASHMTQSAVARFEAGGTVPTLPVLERLAAALNADLVVQVNPRSVA